MYNFLWLLATKTLVWCRSRCNGRGSVFSTPRTALCAFSETDFLIYNVKALSHYCV